MQANLAALQISRKIFQNFRADYDESQNFTAQSRLRAEKNAIFFEDLAIQSMTTKSSSRLNDASALHFINKFGWIRSIELGKLMWPHQSTSRQRADGLLRRLVKRGWALQRTLPDRCGNAYVLTQEGANELFASHDCAEIKQPWSNAQYGKFIDGIWLPTIRWKHNLIAQGVLCDLHRRGFKIFSERDLRGWKIGITKIPDGLAVFDDENQKTFWIEVENARKSGKQMKDLAEAIKIVGTKGVKIGKYYATEPLVAYIGLSRSEKGHLIDHQQRVRNAVTAITKDELIINWYECTQLGKVGVDSIEYSEEIIKNEHWRLIRRQLEKYYKQRDGYLEAHYDKFLIEIIELEKGFDVEVHLQSNELALSDLTEIYEDIQEDFDSLSKAKDAAAQVVAEIYKKIEENKA